MVKVHGKKERELHRNIHTYMVQLYLYGVEKSEEHNNQLASANVSRYLHCTNYKNKKKRFSMKQVLISNKSRNQMTAKLRLRTVYN